LGKLEDRARALGLPTLHLHASLNAQRFYQRSAYAAVEHMRHQLPSGVEIPCISMTKPIDNRERAGRG
jgi:hypothetical protein